MTVKELKKILRKFNDRDILQVVTDWENVSGDGHPERTEITGYAVVEPEFHGWPAVDEEAIREIYLF